jgi:hypothetical protein
MQWETGAMQPTADVAAPGADVPAALLSKVPDLHLLCVVVVVEYGDLA